MKRVREGAIEQSANKSVEKSKAFEKSELRIWQGVVRLRIVSNSRRLSDVNRKRIWTKRKSALEFTGWRNYFINKRELLNVEVKEIPEDEY